MSTKTGIRWTDSTWNPVAGCSKVSPGCAHCYAETLSLRFGRSQLPWTPENAAENVVLHPERLTLPLRWRVDAENPPRRVFVNSMSDLFHELVPVDFVATCFAVMAAAPEHTFQILTKRPERIGAMIGDPSFRDLVELTLARIDTKRKRINPPDLSGPAMFGDLDRTAPRVPWPLPNVWLGTSIENDRWTVRADWLRAAPAVTRFISAEPLLGPLPSLDLTAIDWIIVGGESGPGYRPMDHDWARDIRDRSTAQGTAFYFKQSAAPRTEMGVELDGRRWEQYPDDVDRDPQR